MVSLPRARRYTGQLKAFHTVSTFPVFDGSKNTCADIEISADGKFIYASNRGHNSIAGFAVDITPANSINESI